MLVYHGRLLTEIIHAVKHQEQNENELEETIEMDGWV